jgi:hypothetical protein
MTPHEARKAIQPFSTYDFGKLSNFGVSNSSYNPQAAELWRTPFNDDRAICPSFTDSDDKPLLLAQAPPPLYPVRPPPREKVEQVKSAYEPLGASGSQSDLIIGNYTFMPVSPTFGSKIAFNVNINNRGKAVAVIPNGAGDPKG